MRVVEVVAVHQLELVRLVEGTKCESSEGKSMRISVAPITANLTMLQFARPGDTKERAPCHSLTNQRTLP